MNESFNSKFVIKIVNEKTLKKLGRKTIKSINYTVNKKIIVHFFDKEIEYFSSLEEAFVKFDLNYHLKILDTKEENDLIIKINSLKDKNFKEENNTKKDKMNNLIENIRKLLFEVLNLNKSTYITELNLEEGLYSLKEDIQKVQKNILKERLIRMGESSFDDLDIHIYITKINQVIDSF